MSLVTLQMAAQSGSSSNSNSHNFHNHINGDGLAPDGYHLVSNDAGNPNNQIAPRNGPFAGDDMSRDYNAPPSSFSMPKQTGAMDRGGNPLADFFSSDVFQIVLHNPATAHRLLKFSQARMCGENMEFLEKVRPRPTVANTADKGVRIHRSIGTITCWMKWQPS